MDLKSIKNDLKWRLKYALFKRVLPHLEYEPFTIKNICTMAWPTVSAISITQDYSTGLDEINWPSAQFPDDGSDFLRRKAELSRAVILRGYACDSELSHWSMQDLLQKMPDTIVKVRVGDYLSEFGQPRYLNMPLSTFIKYLCGTAKFPNEDQLFPRAGPYMGNQKLPTLDSQIPGVEFFRNKDGASKSLGDITTFWLGSSSSITPLHNHHFCDTLLVQFIGKRQVTLIPPHEALYIGYVPQNINIGTAAFDPYNPDNQQFPYSDKIELFHIDLLPGDALLIPGFWFHAVKLAHPSLSGSRFARSRMPASLGGGPPNVWKETGIYKRGF